LASLLTGIKSFLPFGSFLIQKQTFPMHLSSLANSATAKTQWQSGITS
jgi:hypothetical protein